MARYNPHRPVLLFATYALLDGIANLVIGFRSRLGHGGSWAQILLGIISAGAGVVAMMMPELTVRWLIICIVAWAIVRFADEPTRLFSGRRVRRLGLRTCH